MNLLKRIKRKIECYEIKRQCFFLKKDGKRTSNFDPSVSILNPNVKVGNNVRLYKNVILWGDGPITIDDNVQIGFNTIIYSHMGVHIGKNSIIAGNSYIIDTNHSVEKININLENPLGTNDSSEKIYIGNYVWVAASCIIGKGSKLNDYCIIGANSFVNSEIPENAIAVGSPAKVIKYRG